jgi:B12 binding protein
MSSILTKVFLLSAPIPILSHLPILTLGGSKSFVLPLTVEIGCLGKFGYLIEVEIMAKEYVLEKYLDALLEGDRTACRAVIEEALQRGTPANQVYMKIIWPIMALQTTYYRFSTRSICNKDQQDNCRSAPEQTAQKTN